MAEFWAHVAENPKHDDSELGLIRDLAWAMAEKYCSIGPKGKIKDDFVFDMARELYVRLCVEAVRFQNPPEVTEN